MNTVRQAFDKLILWGFLGLAGSQLIVVFGLFAYAIKSLLGIDVFPDWHLTDLLF